MEGGGLEIDYLDFSVFFPRVFFSFEKVPFSSITTQTKQSISQQAKF